MPFYVIERNFAEQLDLTGDDVRLIDEVNADEGVRWVFVWLAPEKGGPPLPIHPSLKAIKDHEVVIDQERVGRERVMVCRE